MSEAAGDTTMRPKLVFKNISKRFPGVQALDGVSFEIASGEVHAVVGENGAGKSTLMNILAGAYRADSGTISWDGHTVQFANEFGARRQGVSIVYQELKLCPSLSVTENIFLGREREVGSRRLDWPVMRRRAKEILASLGTDIDPSARVRALRPAERQVVEIAKAISERSEVLVLDEPTSALTLHEVDHLFENLERLRENGLTIIYISHRIEEIFRIGDTVTVLRDGRHIATKAVADTTKNELVTMIAGSELETTFREHHADEAAMGNEPVLEVKGLGRAPFFEDVSFELRKQEVLGIYGLQGAGRSELLETLFGLAQPDFGAIYLNGKLVRFGSPRHAIAAGVAMVTEDRRGAGIIPAMSVSENINTSNPSDSAGFLGLLRTDRMAEIARRYIEKLRIRTSDIRQPVKYLSGGNQQKVIVARWLATHPVVLLVDELTKGVDVGAKAEMFELIQELRGEGLSVLMVSSELEEVLSQTDRLLVMRHGHMVATLSGSDVTRENVVRNALVESGSASGGTRR